ncbi:unnamed protein product, partial [Ascophyllum nodosum]
FSWCVCFFYASKCEVFSGGERSWIIFLVVSVSFLFASCKHARWVTRLHGLPLFHRGKRCDLSSYHLVPREQRNIVRRPWPDTKTLFSLSCPVNEWGISCLDCFDFDF